MLGKDMKVRFTCCSTAGPKMQKKNIKKPHKLTGWGKSETEFLLVLFMNCCILFLTSSCKPAFSPPCIWWLIRLELSNRTYCNEANVLYLHWPIQ